MCSSSGMSEKFSHSDHAKFIGEALVPPEEPASWRVFKDCGKNLTKPSCGNTVLRCFIINIWFFILRSAKPWSRKLALQKQYIAVFGSEPVSLSPSSVHITGSLVGAARWSDGDRFHQIIADNHSYWKLWFVVDLPIKNGDFP
jgi:hypothetical protein